MSEYVVEFKGVSRRFAKTLALDNVSLRIEQGYVYGLVGANGAGKTTLIRHLLGLLRAKQGSVEKAYPPRSAGHVPGSTAVSYREA